MNGPPIPPITLARRCQNCPPKTPTHKLHSLKAITTKKKRKEKEGDKSWKEKKLRVYLETHLPRGWIEIYCRVLFLFSSLVLVSLILCNFHASPSLWTRKKKWVRNLRISRLKEREKNTFKKIPSRKKIKESWKLLSIASGDPFGASFNSTEQKVAASVLYFLREKKEAAM